MWLLEELPVARMFVLISHRVLAFLFCSRTDGGPRASRTPMGFRVVFFDFSSDYERHYLLYDTDSFLVVFGAFFVCFLFIWKETWRGQSVAAVFWSHP